MRILLKLIRKWFHLYDIKDVEHALNTCGYAKDRDDLEWKLKKRLMEMRP